MPLTPMPKIDVLDHIILMNVLDLSSMAEVDVTRNRIPGQAGTKHIYEQVPMAKINNKMEWKTCINPLRAKIYEPEPDSTPGWR